MEKNSSLQCNGNFKMESNKDEAIHCIEIAEKFIGQKNAEKARKYLRKSLKLYPSEIAQNLLLSIEDLPQYEASTCAQLRKQNSSRPGSRPQTTEELDRIIHQILNTNDYYDMLKIENSATEKDIKKSFKKLALLLHPDKTKHPGAGEAFKAIRNAFSILTDPTKRRHYDIYGAEAVFAPPSSCSFRSTFSGKQDGDSSGNASEQNSSEGDTGGLYDKTTKYETFILKLIWPIIFAIILTCVTTFFMHDPSYSLQKSVKYPMLRYTHNLKIPYYVKENFLMENSGLAITQLDNEVEIETITNLQYACYNERSYRNYLLELARERKNSKQISDLLKMRLPSCENLYEMQRVLYM